MRTRHIFTLSYITCLVVSVGRQKCLFAPTDVQKMSYSIQQFSFQRAIANLSYLPFKLTSSRYQTLCHVQLLVSDSSKLLPHNLVNCQSDCGTAGQ